MKLILASFLFILTITVKLYSQNSFPCIDSSFKIKYTSLLPYFSIKNLKSDDKGALLFNGGIKNTENANEDLYDMVFGKIDLGGNLLWAKHANRLAGHAHCSIKDWSAGANSIYWAGSFSVGAQNPFMVKTDTSGNIIWSFSYKIDYFLGYPNIAISTIKYFGEDEIYLLGGGSLTGATGTYSLIIKLKSDGTVTWSKIFRNKDNANATQGGLSNLVKQGSDLYVFGNFLNFRQNNLAGILKMRLNAATGQFIGMTSYSIPKLNEYNQEPYATSLKFANTAAGPCLISGTNAAGIFIGSRYQNKAVKINLDNNFDIKNIVQIVPNNFNSNDKITGVDVNKNNQTCVTINNGLYYYHSLLNDQDSLLRSIKIAAPVKKAYSGGFLDGLAYEDNGTINHLMQYDTPAYDQYELLKLKSNWRKSTEDCMGSDTQYVYTQEISYKPYLFTWDDETNYIAQQQPLDIMVSDLMIKDEVVCKEYNNCDTLKIKGSSNHCLSSPTAMFSVHKNGQCSNKVLWIVDTAFMKITGEPNDTTINVKFLQPFHGYVKAQLDGCVLKDSIFIDVNTSQQSLSLGNDTIYCPNKTITLNAGKGFKTYRWQDNSSNSTFVATQAGSYFIKAVDSCGNVFNDTINIKPIDITLELVFTQPICMYDTAVVILSSKLNNYTWSPSGFANKENNILKLFPDKTTLFNISGELFSGCTLYDTLLINVITCPTYFYIPKAFSPNNDWRNDFFKPTISGRIRQYLFSIYNRYGQIVFRTADPNLGWDGLVKGMPQEPGAFVWTCSYSFVNVPTVFKKGTVVLVK